MPLRFFALRPDRNFTVPDLGNGTVFDGDQVYVPEFTADQHFALAVETAFPLGKIIIATGASQDLTSFFTNEGQEFIGFTRYDILVSDDVFYPNLSGHVLRLLEAA